MSSSFKDHFSGHAGSYASARPTYPEALFTWLASASTGKDWAWDCGTGNGQAAVALARHFPRVLATDASSAQIEHATPAAGVTYRAEPAEHSSLPDHSVDLITVAQAYHWFDHDAFLREAERVLKPGGLLVVWTYAHVLVEASIDRVVQGFYHDIIGPYWPPERKLVEEGYRHLHFPWPELETPAFTIELAWDLPAFEAYLRSWSATQRYVHSNHRDPVDLIHDELAAAWGESARARLARWPMIVRAFRLP